MEEIIIDTTPIEGKFSDFNQFAIQIVESEEEEYIWKEMINRYHYLGLQKIPGSNTKYLIKLNERIIGAISFNGGSLKLEARDKFIGWDAQERKELLCHIVNNNRFLIAPWVKIKNLASHILSRSLKLLREDWKSKYGHEPYLVETFVDSERYKGTCYRAANWLHVGETKGYGKIGKSLVYHGNKKSIFIKEMNKRFIKNIKPHQQSPNKNEEMMKMQFSTPDWQPGFMKEMGLSGDSLPQIIEMMYQHYRVYIPCFSRSEQIDNFINYSKGLHSELERKSVEPIAIRFGGTQSVSRFQKFIAYSKWDHEKMQEIYQNDLAGQVSEPEGMLTIDGCDFPKKGNNSVGVARQHCGILGKTESCQASVMIGYSGKKGYGLIDRSLYLPKKWFSEEYKERFKKCDIPEETEFKTKNQLASEMVQKVIDQDKFAVKWVGVDGAFGDDSNFLDSLPENVLYFADVHSDLKVFKAMPDVFIPEYTGNGRRPIKSKTSFESIKVSDIGNDPDILWNDVILGIGAKGPIISKDKCLRVVEVRNGLPGKWVWLYIRSREDGEIKYTLCNAPEETPINKLREQALRRWSIEQCFEECKSELGMDHFEGRSWQGWHRHILLVFLAHLLLLKIRKAFTVKPSSTSLPPIKPSTVDEFKTQYSEKDNTDPHYDESHTVLTASLARKLIVGILSNNLYEVLMTIEYYLKRRAASYKSYTKSKLKLLLSV